MLYKRQVLDRGAAAPVCAVHLPLYQENAYQPLLLSSLAKLGVRVVDGGGGGNFFRTARFKWKADVLHFHWIHPYIIRSSALATFLRGTRLVAEIKALKYAGQRLVWTVHNLRNHDGRHLKLEQFFSRKFAQLADAIIAHGEYAKKAVMEAFRLCGSHRVTVIPHGNYIGQYGGCSERSEARSTLGIRHDAVAFLLLGRIRTYKGILELLEAFSRLKMQTFLVIAGACPDQQTEQMIRRRCETIPGAIFHCRYVPQHELKTYFSACDVVALPYHDMLTSGSAILAMSFGKPCIAPNAGCFPETFASAGAILYNDRQEGGLLGAMRDAVIRKAELPAMGVANLARAKEWNWDLIARKTRDVYEQCLSG